MASQKHILVQSSDTPGGLHCINLETGNELWWFDPLGNTRGHTPAVDQSNGIIYYQTRNRLWKINALNGALIDFAIVTNPAGSGMGSGNTVLVNDAYGYFIAGVWNDYVAYGGGVKVYDINLDLVWDATGIKMNLKTCMAYYDGVLYVGTGNGFGYQEQIDWYTGTKEEAKVTAYDITNGTVLWEYECDPDANWQIYCRAFIEVFYCNGYIVAPCSTPSENEIHILDASDGSLIKKYVGDSTGYGEACAPSVLTGGRLYVGSLQNDGVRVVQIGTGDYKDWNLFGNQMNHNVPHVDALKTIAAIPSYVGFVTGSDQGGAVFNNKAYFIQPNCTIFNPDTLAKEDTWITSDMYDSTPLILENLSSQNVLLIKEASNARVIAIDIATGTRLWNSADNMLGNLFFGMNYYESAFKSMENAMTSAEYISAINDNFTALNALVGDAASLTTITNSLVGQDLLDAISANVNALNAELGTPVAWSDIILGETGLSANSKLNTFNIAYKLVI